MSENIQQETPAPSKLPSLFLSPWFLVFVMACITLVIVGLWFRQLRLSTPAPVGIQVKAQPAKEIKSTPKAKAPVKNGSVSVYGAAVKDKLVLPREVIENTQVQVVASTQVKGDDHPQTTTTALNLDTGEFETYTRRDPLPWIAWDNHGKIGMYGGLVNGRTGVKLEAEQGVFQVKAVHFGVNGHITQELNPPPGSTGTDWFVGGGAWYRW